MTPRPKIQLSNAQIRALNTNYKVGGLIKATRWLRRQGEFDVLSFAEARKAVEPFITDEVKAAWREHRDGQPKPAAHWFGLHTPEGIESPAVWGARAITNMDGLIDLLGDRQSMQGKSAEREALGVCLNDLGIIDAVKAEYQRALSDGRMDTRKDCRVRLYEDPLVIVEGNTNGSCGYLYLVAWFKPRPDLTTLRSSDEDEGEMPIWSGSHTVPALGEVIRVPSAWGAKDDAKTAEVIGYTAIHGYLSLWVRILHPNDDWTETYEREVRRFVKTGNVWRSPYLSVMGVEFQPLETA